MMDWKNITMWVLVVALFGLLVTVIVLMILQKTHDIKGEFVKDMLTMNTPIINFLTENNPKTKKADIEKIYDQNKEQIDCVYKNKETRNAFKQLVSSNCLIKEMVDKVYSLLLHFDTKSGKTGKATPEFHLLAALLFTLVYALQSKNSTQAGDNMCGLFGCNYTPNSGDIPALFSDSSHKTPDISKNKDFYTVGKDAGKPTHHIINFFTYLMNKLTVDTRMFNENAGKFKKYLDNMFDPKSSCEYHSKNYTVSEFNSVHNLLTTVKDHLIMMALPPFVKDLICLKEPNLVPGLCGK